MSLLITAGHAGDSPQFEAVMDAIGIPRRGPGRPRQRPERVLADKAYSSRRIRDWLRRRGITEPSPSRLTSRHTAGGEAAQAADRRHSTRSPTGNATSPNACINRVKQWRGLAMRTDKLAVHSQATLTLASILFWTKP